VEVPEVRYAKSGELSIAYQVFGQGDLDLVFVPGFVSHADLAWEIPVFSGVYRRLASFARVVTFDKRGTGLSDRTLGFGTVEDRMDDIRAVMDAAAVPRAAIFGISEGGPMALLFAATYPERVTALVLMGTFARILRAPDFPQGADPALIEAFVDGIAAGWGAGGALANFIANMPDSPASTAALARYERNATTPGMVQEILTQNVSIDVRAALPAVSAPTLVLHHAGDRVVPRRFGRDVAERIEGAQWVELPGDVHVDGSVGGEDDALDAIEAFLTGQTQRAVDADRALKTVFFSDIVGSTEQAATVGDRRWHALLDEHDTAVRRELDRHDGTEVKTTGDGFLAVFDGPARAIRCAQAIVASSAVFGLRIRAGIHVGEVEIRGDDVAGLAVHIGSRVAALADADEVLVTRTVRDLVTGSGIAFSDRGMHALKGVPGEWQLLAVRT